MSLLSPILAKTPVAAIGEVVACMTAIDQALPSDDGISCFNKLYLGVTQNVLAAVDSTAFTDPAFLAALDVEFANLYFSALRCFDGAAGETPHAWAPLFAVRSDRTIAPIQFALAGMNAHINRDLPVALVTTFAARGLSPSAGCPQHQDFERVNKLLAATETQVKARYLDELTRKLDVVFDGVDDVVAMWSVARAREAAWTNGAVMWRLRGAGPIEQDYVAALDRTVGFASRGLLVSTGQ